MLGLGDTNLLMDRQSTTAADCNQAAQALDGALRFLGAAPLCERCEANDAVRRAPRNGGHIAVHTQVIGPIRKGRAGVCSWEDARMRRGGCA